MEVVRSYRHTNAHSVVLLWASKSVMNPTKEAGAESQAVLRSHSDNHLTRAREPSLRVQSLGGMVRRPNPAKREGGGLRWTCLDVVSVGHQGGPSLMWCHRRANVAFPVPCGSLMTGAHRRQDTAQTVSLKRLFTNPCLSVTSTMTKIQSKVQSINCRVLSLSPLAVTNVRRINTQKDSVAQWLPA